MQELIDWLGLRFSYVRELLMLGLVLARVMPMVFISPFMGGQSIPSEAKMSIGLLLTLLVWPLAHDSLTADIPIYALPFLLVMLKETLIGFAIGFANAHIFYAMETAGRLIDTARGASMSEIMVPSSRQRATAIGTLYSQFLMVFFVGLGGHHIFLDTFFRSFVTIPINEAPDLTPGLSPVAHYAVETCSQVLMIAVLLAAPAVAATFITDLVFGILNRVAPQLNAYFLAMPVKAAGAVALILVSLAPFVERLEAYTIESLNAAERMVGFLMRN